MFVKRHYAQRKRAGRRARGFSLIELMIVVAIVAILATLAAPNIADTIQSYRAREMAVDVLQAFNEARTQAQASNGPIRLRLDVSGVLVVETPTEAAGTSFTDILKVVDSSNWNPGKTFDTRRATFDAATNTVLSSGIYFCPSSRGTYREDTATGAALCALGDLTSHSLTARYTVLGFPYEVELWAAVGNARFKSGT